MQKQVAGAPTESLPGLTDKIDIFSSEVDGFCIKVKTQKNKAKKFKQKFHFKGLACKIWPSGELMQQTLE